MKTLIALLFSCASVCGADGDIRVVATAKTNAETAGITTTDFDTTDGQTNLVRHTKTKAGAVQIGIHRFYHAGRLVGDYVAMPGSSGFTTEPGTAYSVSVECDASRNPKSVVIGTKDGVVLVALSHTSAVCSPVASSVLQKANAVGADVKQLFDPERVRESTPEGFVREAEKWIEKHKER